MIALIQSADMHVLVSLYAIRSREVVQICIWVSELGTATTICGLSVCVALALALRRHFSAVMGLFTTVAASGIGTLLIKGLVARPRPPLSFQAYQEAWWSFPSAHAVMSLAFYGFLVCLTWYFAARRSFRLLALVLATILVLAIGFARLYLGVHYLSDVIGGYALGAACLWLGVWSMYAVRPTRVVESPHGNS